MPEETSTTERENVIVSLTSGSTHLAVPRRDEPLRDDGEPQWAEGGLIYSDRGDMPSLERLLEEHRVAMAIVERVVGMPPGRVAAATSLAVAVATAGFVLLGIDLAGDPSPNAILALALALGGLVLLATVVAAIKRWRA